MGRLLLSQPQPRKVGSPRGFWEVGSSQMPEDVRNGDQELLTYKLCPPEV